MLKQINPTNNSKRLSIEITVSPSASPSLTPLTSNNTSPSPFLRLPQSLLTPRAESWKNNPDLNSVSPTQSFQKVEKENFSLPASQNDPQNNAVLEINIIPETHNRFSKSLLKFSESEYSSENIKFCNAVNEVVSLLEEEHLKTQREIIELEKTSQFQGCFKNIYNTYLSKEASLEINIDFLLKDKFEKEYRINQFNLNTFKEALHIIETLSLQNIYKRFEKSNLYKKAMYKIKKEDQIVRQLLLSIMIYLNRNKKDKTKAQQKASYCRLFSCCCTCCTIDKSAIYSNLENLQNKIKEIMAKPNIASYDFQETIQSSFLMHINLSGNSKAVKAITTALEQAIKAFRELESIQEENKAKSENLALNPKKNAW